MANCLNLHINSSSASNHYQSAYKKFHSIETALLKIHNDFVMYDGRVTVLTLFDFYSAFDAIQSINQSINQSNFYSANIPGVVRLSGATARSVFKCEVVEVVP